MIKKNISRKILTIGPAYSNHRGGIGSVIDIYSKNIENFKFISTYGHKTKYGNIFYYVSQIIQVFHLLIHDKEVEIIHIHGASNGSFYRKGIIFFLGKYIFRKKIVYHIHGAKYDVFYNSSNILLQLLIRFMLEKVDMVICLSKSWAKYFQNNFKIKRLEILNNVIEFPDQKRINNRKGTITALFLGEIGQRKGIFDIIDVIIENRNIFENRFKLYVGGNGEIGKFQKLIMDNKLGNLVSYVGWVTGEQKKCLFQKASIYILPSYHEGLPISILEAMSYGLPIISTNVGGISEIVKDKINGFLLTPGDKKAFNYALNYFIDNPTEINNYGKESLKIVAAYYPNIVFDRLKHLYEDILNNIK